MKKLCRWLSPGFSLLFLLLTEFSWANDCAGTFVAGPTATVKTAAVDYDPALMGGLSPAEVSHLLGMLRTAAQLWQKADPATDPEALEKQALAQKVLDPQFSEKDITEVLHASHHHHISRYEKDPTQPVYNGNNFPGIRIVEDPDGWYSYESTNRPANPVAEVVLWPGYGSNISHAGSFLLPSDIFTRASNSLYQELALLMIKNKGVLPAEIYTKVMDLVNSGKGPRSDENNFATLEDFAKRMADHLRTVKDRTQLPLVIIARSASAGLLLSVVQKYPDLVDGIILIGPTHADLDIGYKSSMAAFLFKLHKREMVGNFPAITWIDKMYHQMTWQNDPDPFHGIPTLVLVGSVDTEVSPEARQWFQEMAKKYRNVRFHIMPNSDHDVLAIANFARARNRVVSAQQRLKQDLDRGALIYNVLSIIKNYHAASPALAAIDDEELGRILDRYSVAHYGRQWGSELASNLMAFHKARNDEKRAFIIGKMENLLDLSPAPDAFSPVPSFSQKVIGDLVAVEMETTAIGDVYNPLKAYELIEYFLIRNFLGRFERHQKKPGQENFPNTLR